MVELVESQEYPYELPEGWVWTSLGEISNRIKGKKPKVLGPKSDDLTVPYVDIEAFEKKVFKAYTDGKDCPICEPADILIVWDGARCGLVGGGVEGVIGSTLAKLVYYDLNSAYLFHFLQTQYDLINKNPRGVGIPHIEPIIFWNISFPLPPLNEQYRIVAKLEALLSQGNAAKEHLAKVPPLMKQFRQSVLAAACSGRLTEEWRKEYPEVEPASELLKRIQEERIKKAKAGGRRKRKKQETLELLQIMEIDDVPELPDTWAWIRLGDVNETTSGGTPKRSNKAYYGGDIPWLKSGELEDNIITKTEEKITDPGLKNSSAKIFPKGTLLIALYGATVGKTGKLAIESATNQAICGIFNDDNVFFDQYLWHYLVSFRNELIRESFGGAQPNISQEIIRNLKIPLPSLSEQHVIVERVEQLFKFADEVEHRYQKAKARVDQLTQSILAKAFRGELVPQDPNDEPASVLLERIKQERAKNEKGKKKKARNRKLKTLSDYS